MKILISPYSKPLKNGKLNPKNYPFWQELIDKLIEKGHEVKQIGIGDEVLFNNITNHLFNQPIRCIEEQIKRCDLWISVDNFFHHCASYVGKPGIVLWSQSDPEIFGNKMNINLLKDRRYLRTNQFDIWEVCEFWEDSFVKPEIVLEHIR